jgi:hypothetical protein
LIGSKCPILFSPHCPSQDLQGLVRPSYRISQSTLGSQFAWKLMIRDTLPTDWQSALLRLLLQTLSFSLSPSNPRTHQAGNGIVVRKLFGSVCPRLASPISPWPSPPNSSSAFTPRSARVSREMEADDQASITPPPYTPSPIYKSPYNSYQLDPIVHSHICTSSRISPWVGVQYSP